MKKEKNSELTYQDVVQPVKLRILLVSLFDPRLRLSCCNNILDVYYLRSVDICNSITSVRFSVSESQTRNFVDRTSTKRRKPFGNKFFESKVGII